MPCVRGAQLRQQAQRGLCVLRPASGLQSKRGIPWRAELNQKYTDLSSVITLKKESQMLIRIGICRILSNVKKKAEPALISVKKESVTEPVTQKRGPPWSSSPNTCQNRLFYGSENPENPAPRSHKHAQPPRQHVTERVTIARFGRGEWHGMVTHSIHLCNHTRFALT